MELIGSRKAKASTRLAQLVTTDRLLLSVLVEREPMCSETHLGAILDVVFRAYGNERDLIAFVLPKAVQLTASPELLWRQDSVLTDIVKSFLKFNGTLYLKKVLKSTLESVLQRVKAGEDFGIEVGKATPASVSRVLQVTNELMLNVISKLNILPGEIKLALSTFSSAAEARFGREKRALAVAGLFWLRFICPAIVDPVSAGALKRSVSITPQAQRALLSISKTVKACADGQVPDQIEPSAGTTLKELSDQWRPRLDAAFRDFKRQSIDANGSAKVDNKEAVASGWALLAILQRRRTELLASLALMPGTENLIASLEEVLDSVLSASARARLQHGYLATAALTHFAAIDSWTPDQVLAFLDLLGMSQYKPGFAKRSITGKALLALDYTQLASFGIDNEEEQWMLLQSVRDYATLRQRYQTSVALTPVINGVRSFPSLETGTPLQLSASSEAEEGSQSSGSPSPTSSGKRTPQLSPPLRNNSPSPQLP